MCLAWVEKWMIFTNPVGTGGVLDVCFGCGGVGGEWVGGLDQGLEGWGYVWILCVDGRSRYLYIVLGGYLRIISALSAQSCCTLWLSAS